MAIPTEKKRNHDSSWANPNGILSGYMKRGKYKPSRFLVEYKINFILEPFAVLVLGGSLLSGKSQDARTFMRNVPLLYHT